MKGVLESAPEFVLSGQDYISPPINLLVSSIQRVYFNFVDTLNQVVYSAFIAKPIEWEYVIEPTSGLKVLKSKKDPKALDRIQQMADDLFK